MSIAHNDVAAYYAPLRHYHQFVDCAIGVSTEVHRKLTIEGLVPPERTRYIPYGVVPVTEAEVVERARPRPPDSPLRVGYVGRVVQSQKRVLDMVPLVLELKRRDVPFCLDVVGDGGDRALLAAEFRRRGLSDGVRFWGWQTGDDLAARFRELDVFLLMSDHEGLPVALLEAMGHGLVPVVSRTDSGNTELVRDGENGYVVPIGDVAGFADRIAGLARDPVKLSDLKLAAWRTSQDYTLARMADGYRECLVGLAAREADRAARPPGVYPVMGSCRSRYPLWARKVKALLRSVGGGR